MITKRCRACDAIKPVDEFYPIRRGDPSRRRSKCILCCRELSRDYVQLQYTISPAYREAERQRSADRYRDDPEFHARQLEHGKAASKRRGTE